MNAQQFLAWLEKSGFDFFSGVPCSYLGPFCRALEPRASHVPAPREDIALGLAAGAYLAGKLPLVYMQNSGLGYSLEVLASLHLIYRLPLLVLLSYRGPEDQGWEEHLVMGEHTLEILDTFALPYAPLAEPFTEKELANIKERLLREEKPFFLLVGKGGLS